MSLIIDCPSGHRLKIPDKYAGRRLRCPVCDEPVFVPLASGSATPTSSVEVPRMARPEELCESPLANVVDDGVPDAAKIASPMTGDVVRNAATVPEQISAAIAPQTAVDPVSALELRQHTPQLARDDDDVDTPRHSTSDDQLPPEFAGDSETLREAIPPAWTQEDPRIDGREATMPTIACNHRQGPVQSDSEHRTVWQLTYRLQQAKTATLLAAATFLVASFCVVPSLLDHVTYWQGARVEAADTWTYFVLLGALIQVATAIYAARLPHWATSWVASLVSVGLGSLYVMVMALTTFASHDHPLVQDLGLLDEAFHRTVQPWCFLVVCVCLLLAYAYGRFSMRWYCVESRFQADSH